MVMGATHGIGRAYAEHFAKRGAALHLVARTASELASVAGELVRLGAKECTVAAGDVLDANFREMLAALLHDPRFAAVFIGGPSPRPGSIHEASPDDFGYGIAVVFEYPEHILRIVSQRTAAIDIVFVSSAASREPLTASHRFFVSAVLRRAWDIWIPLLASGLPPHIRLHVWRPGVIRRCKQFGGGARDSSQRICGSAGRLRAGIRRSCPRRGR